MTGIQHDTSTDYTADLAISAPIESVFAAISTVRGLGGWWTPDTSGSADPGGELRRPRVRTGLDRATGTALVGLGVKVAAGQLA